MRQSSPRDGLVAGVGRAARVGVREEWEPEVVVPVQGIAQEGRLGAEARRLMDNKQVWRWCVVRPGRRSSVGCDVNVNIPTHPLDPDGVGVRSTKHRYPGRRAEPGACDKLVSDDGRSNTRITDRRTRDDHHPGIGLEQVLVRQPRDGVRPQPPLVDRPVVGHGLWALCVVRSAIIRCVVVGYVALNKPNCAMDGWKMDGARSMRTCDHCVA